MNVDFINMDMSEGLVLSLVRVSLILVLAIIAAALVKRSDVKSIILNTAFIFIPIVFVYSIINAGNHSVIGVLPNFKSQAKNVEEITDSSTVLRGNAARELVRTDSDALDREVASNFESSANSSDRSSDMTVSTVAKTWGGSHWLEVLLLLVSALLLLQLFVSQLKIMRLQKKSATGKPYRIWSDIVSNKNKNRKLYFVSSAIAPCAIGVVNPRVIISSKSTEWKDERLLATLTHEASHLLRYDTLFRLIASLVRALFWCHPLIWIAYKQLIQAQEEACDEMVLSSGVNQENYAEELLAASCRMGQTPREALAMAQWSQLGKRIKNILEYKHKNKNRNTMKMKITTVTSVIILSAGIALTGYAQTAPNLEVKKQKDELNEELEKKKAQIERVILMAQKKLLEKKKKAQISKELLEKKLKIIIPQFHLGEDSTVRDAVNLLRLQARVLDTQSPAIDRGINFITRDLLLKPEIGKIQNLKLGEFVAFNKSIEDLLKDLCQRSGLKYVIENNGVVITVIDAEKKIKNIR